MKPTYPPIPKKVGDKLRKVLEEHPDIKRNLSILKKMNHLATEYPNKYNLKLNPEQAVLYRYDGDGYPIQLEGFKMFPLEKYFQFISSAAAAASSSNSPQPPESNHK